MLNDLINYESQKAMDRKEETVIPIIFKQFWLWPLPLRLLFTLAKYTDEYHWPFLGLKEKNNKTYLIVGAGKYYAAMRLWNIRNSVIKERKVSCNG